MDTISVVLLVAAGYMLKKIGIVQKELSDSLMKVIFYIFLPATIFYSIVQLELKEELILLPVSGFIVALSCYIIGYLLTRGLRMEKELAGPSIIASGAMNQVLFTYPFFLIYIGTRGLGYAAFYDLGQAALGLSLGYYIALKYGKNSFSGMGVLKNMVSFPPLPTLAFALLVNYLGFYPNVEWLMPHLEFFHNTTTPLVMLFLGVFLEPRLTRLKEICAVLFTRFIFSLLLAAVLVKAFGLAGLEETTVMIASIAPPAMLTLIYASKEKLDTEYTAALISAGIIIGLIYMPLLFAYKDFLLHIPL